MRQEQGGQQFRVTARARARASTRDGLFVVMRERKLKGQEKLQTLRKPRPVEVRLADGAWTRTRCARGARDWHVKDDMTMLLMMVKQSSPCPSPKGRRSMRNLPDYLSSSTTMPQHHRPHLQSLRAAERLRLEVPHCLLHQQPSRP